jgi:hypothetical protein
MSVHHYHGTASQAGTKPKDPDLTPKNRDWICIESNVLHWDLYYMLGEGNIVPMDGGGGWEVVARPEQVGLVDWPGMSPWGLEIPITMDGWVDAFDPVGKDRVKNPPKYLQGKGEQKKKKRKEWIRYRDERSPRNIEQYVQLLIDLSRPAKAPPGAIRPRDEPPPMRVYGKSIPSHLNGHRFVIEDIDWIGDADEPRILGPNDNLRRQECKITFLQHVDEGYYRLRKRKKRKGKGGKGEGKGDGKDTGKRIYIVREGDTLVSVAASQYGDPTLWKILANENEIRNPRSLESGQEILLP